jgi:NurA-like 5'-3' nuclease
MEIEVWKVKEVLGETLIDIEEIVEDGTPVVYLHFTNGKEISIQMGSEKILVHGD